ncbi:MAG: CehA/McbA family metallohydrolase [Candidatus Eisenbacteria bacterium]
MPPSAWIRSLLLFAACGFAVPVPSPADEGGSPPTPAVRSCGDSVSTVRHTALLSCTIIDLAEGETLEARCSIRDALGSSRYPLPADSCLYSTAESGYFYTKGSFSLRLPTGPNVVRAGRGFERRAAEDTVDLHADTSIVLFLERWIDMNALGWYGGDTHVHICHEGGCYTPDAEDAWLVARAEGLSVINCLDNTYEFTGGPDPCGTPDCVVYMSEEHRTLAFGHAGFLGLSSLVYPLSPPWWPLIMDTADSVHAQPGALVISAHPISTDDFFDVDDWPGTGLARELPMDVIGGKIDGFDLLSYSNCHHQGRELDFWYRLLNCGFRLPGTAGTDACVNRATGRPAGGYRVYVDLRGDPFTYASWTAHLAAGRTFVTNGPLFTEFSALGLRPGDHLDAPGIGPLEIGGEVAVACEHPLARIDIVVNGEIALSIPFAPGTGSVDTTFSLSLDESAWVAARVFGQESHWHTTGESLFAHTGPVYFTLDGARIARGADAAFFVAWLDDLDSLASAEGSWGNPDDSARVFDEIASARAFYESLADSIAVGAPRAQGPSLAFLAPARPNPFRSSTSLPFFLNAPEEIRIEVFSPSGRLVRSLLHRSLPGGAHHAAWDGRDERGREAAPGVYLVRMEAGGVSTGRKAILLR